MQTTESHRDERRAQRPGPTHRSAATRGGLGTGLRAASVAASPLTCLLQALASAAVLLLLLGAALLHEQDARPASGVVQLHAADGSTAGASSAPAAGPVATPAASTSPASTR